MEKVLKGDLVETGMEISSVMFALLRFEINGTELCEEMKNSITAESLPALFKLSKKHDLAHLVGDALDKNGLLPDGSEAKKRFLQERNMAVYRYEQQQYELDQVCAALEDAKILFVPLKGSVIRRYYPEPWMRTSCDIDILVEEDVLELASQTLCEKLGYVSENQRDVNELSLYAPSGVHLELHYDLTEGDRYGKDILSNIWEYTIALEGKNYQKQLTDAAFYFYHIAHMVKHFENGGCGVRPFLDLLLLNNRVSASRIEREQLLEQGALLKFAQASEKLALAWFGDVQHDDITKQLEVYILTGGVYGTLENRVSMQQAKTGSKWKYILSRIFISNKELKIKYPQLNKRPWLIPFYHIKRWVKPLTNKASGKQSVNELSKTASVEEKEKQAHSKLLCDLGLR